MSKRRTVAHTGEDDAQIHQRTRKKPTATAQPFPSTDTSSIPIALASDNRSANTSNYGLASLGQFLITATATLVLQTVFSAVVEKTRGKDLGNVARRLESTWSALGLTAWKLLELAVGWAAGYGSKPGFCIAQSANRNTDHGADVGIAPFIALLRLPHMYLLNAFYEVPFGPLLAELVAHFLSASIGFSIYRRPANYNTSKSVKVLGPTMRADYSFHLECTVFSAALNAVIVLVSMYTWLPVHLAVYWDGLKSLDKAHEATILSMLQHFAGIGWCTTYLLLDYASYESREQAKTQDPVIADEKHKQFDPVTASLGEHLQYNIANLLFWQRLKPSCRSLLKHTMFLAVCLTIDAAFQSCATISGCELSGMNWIAGPLPWGMLWGFGMIVSGVALGWVAGVI